ncbi:MAG: glycosyltransferase family 4 protein, partial [Dehalococcoidia bacterium]
MGGAVDMPRHGGRWPCRSFPHSGYDAMTPDKREVPVRVAMVIAGYHPLIGGAERQLMALAPRLQARGVDVHVVTRRYPGLEPFETVAGIPVHRLAAPGTRATRSILFTLAAVRRIARLRPDVVHAHELYSPTTVALLAKRLLGIPVVAKVPRGGELGSIASLSRRALGRRRVAWLCRGVDAFVTISRDIDCELEAIGVPPERRAAIPN